MRASLQLAPWIVLLTAACSSGPAVSRVQPGDPPLSGDADESTSSSGKSSANEDDEKSSSAQTTQPAGATCKSDCRAESPKAAATLVQEWSACLAKCTTASCKSACEARYRASCEATTGCNELLQCLTACP